MALHLYDFFLDPCPQTLKINTGLESDFRDVFIYNITRDRIKYIPLEIFEIIFVFEYYDR